MFNLQFKKISIVLVLASAFFAFLGQANAQQSLAEYGKAEKTIIKLAKIDESQLPAAGQPLELKAELLNTRDFRQPLKVLLIRDQQFQEFHSEPALLDSRETPQYSVTVPAPLVELEYQFILNMPDGTIITSPKHSIKRNCIPNIEPALEQIDSQTDDSKKFDLLVAQNSQIENELHNLESAVSELKQLTSMLAK